jgi:hypothetical protein
MPLPPPSAARFMAGRNISKISISNNRILSNFMRHGLCRVKRPTLHTPSNLYEFRCTIWRLIGRKNAKRNVFPIKNDILSFQVCVGHASPPYYRLLLPNNFKCVVRLIALTSFLRPNFIQFTPIHSIFTRRTPIKLCVEL